MIAGDLVPYDAFARTDLGSYFQRWEIRPGHTMAGGFIRRDPSPQDFAYGALGTAYYFADRPSDSLTALKKMKEPWKTSLAVAYVRLGRLEEACAIMATFRKDDPNWTIEKEALWPTTKKPQFAEPFLKTFLADSPRRGCQRSNSISARMGVRRCRRGMRSLPREEVIAGS